MPQILRSLLFLLFINTYAAPQLESTHPNPKGIPLFSSISHRFHQIVTEGRNELYLSGYAWHNRYFYNRHKIRQYNELAWGGGFGKGFYDDKGNWHSLAAIAFLDSHQNIEPTVGYTFLKIATLGDGLKIGAGYTALVTSRADLYHHIPFPGVLPWVSLIYRQATVSATYIPGSRGVGNVVYMLGKWTLDKI